MGSRSIETARLRRFAKKAARRTPNRALVLAVVMSTVGGCWAGESQAASWWDALFARQPAAETKQPQTEEAQPHPDPPPQATSAAPPPTIPVVRPKVQTVTDYVEVTGNAASTNTVKLIARIEGYLEKLHFADGALVKKGDLLFTIQQDQYKAQLQQAQAQLMAQQAALFYAKTEVARYTALLRKDAATQTEVDHWNYEQKKAEAGIIGAQAQIEIAKLNLDYTEVRAPFDGLMGKHLVDPWNVVGGPGQPTALAEILQLSPIYVVATLSEQQVLQIRANINQRRLALPDLVRIPIDVGLENGTSFPYHGTIEYVAPGIDPSTGTLLVRGILPNADRALLPGFFVRMRLPKGRVADNALLVPNRALGEDQGGRYLLVLNKDDVVEQRYVQIGELVGALRVIESGLAPDERVVIGELWRASPGVKVKPKLLTTDAAPDGAAAGSDRP